LFILREFWFAIIYLIVDFFPAVITMWHKFQEEKNWKVIVSIKTYKFKRKIVFPVSLSFCSWTYCVLLWFSQTWDHSLSWSNV
jgi:hypothetical protein